MIDLTSHKYLYFKLILIILFSNFSSISQNYNKRFEHISIEEGLSQSVVYCSVQDKKGFLWFGTQDGLNRYDGYNFKVFLSNHNNKNSISSNQIQSLCVDHEGFIWIGTKGGGLNKLDPEKEAFTVYLHDPDNNSISHNEVLSIIEDSDHQLLIGTNGGGLNIFDPEEEKFTHYKHDQSNINSISNNFVQCIFEDSKKRIWLGTIGEGLNLFDKKNGGFKRYKNTPKTKNSISGNHVYAICEDHLNNLWIGTRNSGLNYFNINSNNFKLYAHDINDENSISSNRIITIFKDNNDNIWIGTEGDGINFFNRKKDNFIRFQHDPLNASSLNNNKLCSIIQDRSGLLWFGTWGGGVNKYNPNAKKFKHYKHHVKNPNSLSDNVVYPVFEDNDGFLWFGTQKGLNRYDRKKYIFKHFIHDPNNKTSISFGEVYAIIEDHEGYLWIGTWGGGLNKFDKKTNSFEHFKHDLNNPNSLSNDYITSMVEDRYGEIWISTIGGGLSRLSKDRKKFTNYLNDPEDKKSISHNELFCVYLDSSNDIWVGTWSEGVNKFNRTTNDFSKYVNSSKNSSKDNNTVLVIREDLTDSNMLWIGTGSGINTLNKETQLVTRLIEHKELSNNTIFGILEDHNNNLWITSNRNLSKYNKITKEIVSFDKKDGIQSNEFNSWGACKTKDGEFYFSGINGITAFYPDSIKQNDYKPPVVITNFNIFNKPIDIYDTINGNIILKKSITHTKQITLSYKNYVFSLEFAALNYDQPEKNKYAYILEGFEKQWNYIENRRIVSYTNLPHGKYTFRVKASNNDGIWNKNDTKLIIIITPPFWKTLWFKILFILFIIGLIYAWVVWRFKVIKKQKEILKHEVSERTKELQASNATKDKFFSIISHDLKSPFNAILGFTEILEEKIPLYSKEKIAKLNHQVFTSAKQVYALVENLLSWSRAKSGNIQNHPEVLNLMLLIENTCSVLRVSAKTKKIDIQIKIPSETYVFADENLISAVIRNLLSNAIKYSKENSIIKIETVDLKNEIQVSITDTGIGIAKENIAKLFREDIHFSTKGTMYEKGTGLGLILCKEFIEIINGKIWVESKQGKGSTFSFNIPKSS